MYLLQLIVVEIVLMLLLLVEVEGYSSHTVETAVLQLQQQSRLIHHSIPQ